MKISHRLYVTVAPAVLGVFTIAALAYWGQYARQAPELLVAVAVVAAVGSLVVAWSNARFIAHRIERLAGASATAKERLGDDARLAEIATGNASAPGSLHGVVSAVAPTLPGRASDEIDTIERAVDRLSRAVDVAASDRVEGERRAAERIRDHARLLTFVVADATQRLDEVRLPLHILLDNHFGDLNENQEEMLGSARSALEAVDTELVSLGRIAELDLGERPMRLERVKPSELVEAIRSLLTAAAESEGATLQFDVAPLLPAVAADRAQLQEALATLLRLAIAGAGSGAALVLTVGLLEAPTDAPRSPRAIGITLRGGAEPRPTIHSALATRIIVAHGGSVERSPGLVRVTLPIHEPASARGVVGG